jgi:hypothetical protein
VAFLGESFISGADMSMRSVFLASLLNSASKVERKGLRDIGLLPELKRPSLAGDCRSGELARLRKGLLEERLSVSPGDGCRSVIRKDCQRRSCFVTTPMRCETSDGWALPGIDGPANMMLSSRPIKRGSQGCREALYRAV